MALSFFSGRWIVIGFPNAIGAALDCFFAQSQYFSLIFQYFRKSMLSAYEEQHIHRFDQGVSETLLERLWPDCLRCTRT